MLEVLRGSKDLEVKREGVGSSSGRHVNYIKNNTFKKKMFMYFNTSASLLFHISVFVPSNYNIPADKSAMVFEFHTHAQVLLLPKRFYFLQEFTEKN